MRLIHEVRRVRESVREFPVLLASPIAPADIHALPAVEGVSIKLNTRPTKTALNQAAQEIRALRQALHTY